ncbi:MAG: PEGA domain-containing protein [Polyangiaceae bacterium]
MSIARSIAMGLLLGVLTPVGEARADPGSPADIEEARAHYRRGVELYDAKKYEAALVELERANSLAPTYRLLYNIALVQEQLGDAAGALRSFGSYLDAGADVPAVRRAEVERAMAALVVKVATVTVTSNVAGAEVSVDDGVAGTTPLAAPLRLNAGPHRLAATKDGYRPTTKAIDVVGGDRLEVPFSLEELPPPEPPPPPPPPVIPDVAPVPPPVLAPPAPPSAPPERRPPTWVGWAVTGALATGAVATGVAALAASRTLSGDIDDHATPASTIHGQHGTTVALAATSDVLTGTAALAAGATLYVTLTSRRHSPSAAARIDLHPGPGGLWLSAAF